MKVTGEGKRFIVAASLIAVAAVNTGNNLIYLILSMMLSLLILAVLLLKINLSGLSAEVFSKPPVFAGEETVLNLHIGNDKRFVKTYSVNCFVTGVQAPVYIADVLPRKGVERTVAAKFQRRGLYRYGTLRIRSGFPFIFFYRESMVKASGEVLVYPGLCDVSDHLGPLTGKGIMAAHILSGSGDEMYSLREFRCGDDWRRIHWKVSAKTGALFVKEYADQDSTKMTIILDNLLPAGGDLFEKAVSLSGSLARHFLERGFFVRLISCKKIIPFGKGREHLLKILDILAVIREEDGWDSPGRDEKDGATVLVLKSRATMRGPDRGVDDMVVYADSV